MQMERFICRSSNFQKKVHKDSAHSRLVGRLFWGCAGLTNDLHALYLGHCFREKLRPELPFVVRMFALHLGELSLPKLCFYVRVLGHCGGRSELGGYFRRALLRRAINTKQERSKRRQEN